jgi:hypothetical protein
MGFLTKNMKTEKLATSPCECILLGREGVVLSLVQVQEVHVATHGANIYLNLLPDF